MSDKFFLDTNILIYSFFDQDRKKKSRAEELVLEARKTGLGVISYQVIQEFINACRKFGSRQLTLAEMQQLVSLGLRPLCKVMSSFGLFDLAITVQDRYRLSFFDSLVVAAAIEAECKVLYSEDLRHQMKIEQVEIINPFL